MADLKIKYPASNADTVSLTITLASLASSAAWAGRASTAVDNRTNLDLDHLIGGRFKLGTSPTVSKTVQVYAYAAQVVASGTPTYPDSITGTDAAKTMTSANVALACLRFLWAGVTDATTGLLLQMPPTSIAQVYGGVLPPFWGIFVVQDSGVALDATEASHAIQYHRIQAQSV
jgi:hypothetical protein